MKLRIAQPRLPHHPLWAATRLLLILMCLAILPACGLSTPSPTTSSATVSGTSGTSPVAFVYTTCTCSPSSSTSTASLVGASAHDGSTVWRDTLGQQISAAIMVGDTLYASVILDSTHPTPDIVAVRVATGQVLWRTNLPTADINCCVINADTTTVVVDAADNGLNLNGGLYALNAQNGTIRWHLPLYVDGGPLVHAGVVYALVDPQRFSFPLLNAYRASDGTLLWSGPQGGHNGRIELNSSAIFENLNAPCQARCLAAFSLRDGHQLWTGAEDGGIVAVTDAAVFINADTEVGIYKDGGSTVGALSAKDGSLLWQGSTSAAYYSIGFDVAPVVNGVVYVIGSNGGINSSGGGIAAVRTRDGTVLWQHKNEYALGVIVVNGVAYLLASNGLPMEPGWCEGPCRYWVEARSAATGALLWQKSVPDASLVEPVASDYLGG